MRLSVLDNIGVNEIKLIVEDDVPLLSFDYINGNDRHPNILYLGKYQHPSTGNELVGGINLNYLTKKQRSQLRDIMPSIMQAGNLYGRYKRGSRLAPDIFNNFYRTYNSDNVSGIKRTVIRPQPPANVPPEPQPAAQQQPKPAATRQQQPDTLHPLPIPAQYSTKHTPQPRQQLPPEPEFNFPSDLQNIGSRLDRALAQQPENVESNEYITNFQPEPTRQPVAPQQVTGDAAVDTAVNAVADDYAEVANDEDLELAAESLRHSLSLIGGYSVKPAYNFI